MKIKNTTKLYLLMGVFWAFTNKYPIDHYMFFLGGAFLGMCFGIHKLFILEELREKKLKAYEEMVEQLPKYLEECKNKGQNNVAVFDGKEIKSADKMKEKEKNV